MSVAKKASKKSVTTTVTPNSRGSDIKHLTSAKSALLRAIIENPDEDTPRLEFANLLDENNEDHDRAEYIRLQCRLHTAVVDDPELESDRNREDELLQQNGERWVAETFGRGVREAGFCRGFPESCLATADAFMKRGTEWAQQTPLRDVSLSAVQGRAEQLASCSHLQCLTRLEIHDRKFDDGDLYALAGSPHLARLEGLSIGKTSTGPTRVTNCGVWHLAEAEFFPRLKHLGIVSDWDLDWFGLRPLADSKRNTVLESLYLMNTTMDNRGVFGLAQAGWNNLKELMILGSDITDHGLLTLATSEGLPNLSRIGLWRSETTVEAFRDLAESPHASRLECLDLSHTPLRYVYGDEISSLLDAWPKLHLVLSNCGLSRKVRAELVRRYPGRVD